MLRASQPGRVRACTEVQGQKQSNSSTKIRHQQPTSKVLLGFKEISDVGSSRTGFSCEMFAVADTRRSALARLPGLVFSRPDCCNALRQLCMH